MNEQTDAMRLAVLEQIQLLAHASLQVEYERKVPIAHVPSELVCMFCDDLFHPKSPAFINAFNEDELKDLAVLYGLLYVASERIEEFEAASVADIQKRREWRAVMNFAKELVSRFNIGK